MFCECCVGVAREKISIGWLLFEISRSVVVVVQVKVNFFRGTFGYWVCCTTNERKGGSMRAPS